MEEAPENGKESSHSAHANGINELMNQVTYIVDFLLISENNPTEDKSTIKQQLNSRRVKNSTIMEIQEKIK
jgi:hypothetical protein